MRTEWAEVGRRRAHHAKAGRRLEAWRVRAVVVHHRQAGRLHHVIRPWHIHVVGSRSSADHVIGARHPQLWVYRSGKMMFVHGRATVVHSATSLVHTITAVDTRLLCRVHIRG